MQYLGVLVLHLKFVSYILAYLNMCIIYRTTYRVIHPVLSELSILVDVVYMARS